MMTGKVTCIMHNFLSIIYNIIVNFAVECELMLAGIYSPCGYLRGSDMTFLGGVI